VNRREFIAGLGSAAAWQRVAGAQHRKPPLVGFLGTAAASGWRRYTAAFENRLSQPAKTAIMGPTAPCMFALIPSINSYRLQIATSALDARVPSIYPFAKYVEASV
jgi:hypothetical protein